MQNRDIYNNYTLLYKFLEGPEAEARKEEIYREKGGKFVYELSKIRVMHLKLIEITSSTSVKEVLNFYLGTSE